MSRQAVEATAPAVVGLAGGALERVEPSLLPGAAVALNVAIDRRAWCRVETGFEGVEVESKDARQRVKGQTVAELLAGGRLAVAAHVLHALGVESGLRVVTQSRVPAGPGLGGSPALAVAVAGAVARALDRTLDAAELCQVASAAFAPGTGSGTAVAAAMHGGVVSVGLQQAADCVERLAVDPARVEEALLLVDVGRASAPAAAGPGVPESPGEGLRAAEHGAHRAPVAPDARDLLTAIASAAREVREALLAARFDDVVAPLAREWEASRRLFPGLSDAEIDRAAGIVAAAGGAARGCGGLVLVWAPPGARGPGRREAVLQAVKKAGWKLFPARIDLRGLDVEDAA